IRWVPSLRVSEHIRRLALPSCSSFFFLQAEDGIRVFHVTGVQTCALPISWVKNSRRDLRLGDFFFGSTVSVISGFFSSLFDRVKIGRASCRERVWLPVVALS